LWGAYDLDFPLSVAYVAAYLEENGYHTEVIDLQLPSESLERLTTDQINKLAFVGVSSHLLSYREACRVVEHIRHNNYQGHIFVFGPLGFCLQDTLFDECPGIDFVVIGEEEPTILDLIRNSGSPEAVKGIWYLEDGQRKKTQDREYLRNLDVLPFPARDKFRLGEYFPTPGKYYVLPQITILSSRGCDYNCLFCEKAGGKRLRCRSAENISLEIDEVVHKYGAREICFVDEIFGADRDETLKLAESILKRDYRVFLRISTRVDHLDRGVLSLLKKAGLYSVGFGIESGSDDILRYNNKKITKQQVREAVGLVKSLGLEARGYFMLNMPGETRRSIRQTGDFIKELELDLVNIQIAYPYPNTPFRRLAERKYRIIEEKWNRWEYSDGDDVVFTQSNLTEDYVENAYRRIIRTNYLNIRFIAGWVTRIKTFHDFKYSFLQFLNLVRG
jgi:anaerobic magnesium-protoporphyrin IX monomethyl ester cyclase